MLPSLTQLATELHAVAVLRSAAVQSALLRPPGVCVGCPGKQPRRGGATHGPLWPCAHSLCALGLACLSRRCVWAYTTTYSGIGLRVWLRHQSALRGDQAHGSAPARQGPPREAQRRGSPRSSGAPRRSAPRHGGAVRRAHIAFEASRAQSDRLGPRASTARARQSHRRPRCDGRAA